MRIYWYWPFVRDEELGVGEALARRGHQVTLHTIAGRLGPSTGGNNFRVDPSVPAVGSRTEGTARWLASRATTYPRRARQRAATVAAGNFDVAHIIYLNYFTDGLSLKALGRKVPLVCTVHDVVPHQSRVPARIERALLSRQYEHAGTIVVHHPSVGTRLTAEFAVDPQRIHYVPWAVPQVGPEVPPHLGAATAAHDDTLDDTACTILMFGTLRRNKGVAVLLEAMQRIDSPSIRLIVAGRGFADIEALVTAAAARDPRISAHIGFASAAEKAAFYRKADIVVLPYTAFSSQSAVLHDAYSHHLPVVVTDVGALGDAVREDGTGWVIPPNDVAELASALEHAVDSADARARFRAASARIAGERHPDVVAGIVEALYKAIAY